jgi:hypothetical protein
MMSVEAIQARVEELEKIVWCKNGNGGQSLLSITDEARRARRHVENSKCYSSIWVWCPSNYYDLELGQRKEVLGA